MWVTCSSGPHGADTSSVLAAVYGPRSVPGYKEDPTKANIEVLFKPKNDLPGGLFAHATLFDYESLTLRAILQVRSTLEINTPFPCRNTRKGAGASHRKNSRVSHYYCTASKDWNIYHSSGATRRWSSKSLFHSLPRFLAPSLHTHRMRIICPLSKCSPHGVPSRKVLPL